MAPAPASAATVALLPPANDARHFTASNGGWTSQVTYGAGCVLPGLTCAEGVPSFVASGGIDGASDGHLRAQVQATIGIQTDVTIDWTSPSFTAPSSQFDEATLRVALRPNVTTIIAQGAAVQLDLAVIDDAAPTTPIVVVDDQSLAGSAAWSQTAQGTVAAGAIVPGHSYRVRLSVHVTAAVALSTSGTVDLDDVELRLVDLAGSGFGASGGGGGGGGGGDSSNGATNPSELNAVLRACYGTDVALTDARLSGGRVRVQGLSSFASGTAVVIRNERNRVVARVRVGSDGRFSASALQPSRARRGSARYQAVVGAQASVKLRLIRANALRSARASGRTVKITGKLDARRFGRNVRLLVSGGRGPGACASERRSMTQTRTARLNRRTGAYTLHVRVPAGSGPIVLRTRAVGRISSYSVYAVVS